ncbi:hypothetical protein HU200_050638 [Digitaria exilis]|uniref:Peptidase A1 domain-containing protein n=1 Tax=Digitaria exilis TaxID=1010633 RepID=A0A835AS39_9POAL|nr:hypothetical protein HU200_050638 [Digitaria exilis]
MMPPTSSGGPTMVNNNAPATTAGLYVADLLVGTPPQNISGVLDISTQLVRMQCASWHCIDCRPPPVPTFYPKASSTAFPLPCNNDTCQSLLPQNCTDSNICRSNEHIIISNNGSTTQGYLTFDTFTFGTAAVDMLFGCSESTTGNYSGAFGAIGLGRGELSLVSQLGLSNFSYLLAPYGSDGSVQLGGVAVPSMGSSTTPLYNSSAYPDQYYVGLTGVYVDGEEVDGIPAGTFDLQNDGSGGVFLSTTEPITYLLSDAYYVVRQAFASRISAQPLGNVSLCYTAESMVGVHVPELTLVFDGVDGGDDVKMELNKDNYLIEFNDGERDVECLAVLPSVGASLLGSLLQTGTEMIYDLEREQLTFVMTDTEDASLASAGPVPSLAVTVAVALWLALTSRPDRGRPAQTWLTGGGGHWLKSRGSPEPPLPTYRNPNPIYRCPSPMRRPLRRHCIDSSAPRLRRRSSTTTSTTPTDYTNMSTSSAKPDVFHPGEAPRRNEFNNGEHDVECLAVLPSAGASLLGSLLQTGTEMIYDLEREQLTFVMTDTEDASLASAGPAPSLAMDVAVALWVVRLLI